MSKKTGNRILIENAHHNNLKHLDLQIPHGQLTVVTGVSGSGKSSLAFDTIYAEGQRRYVETFSPYARQFLDRMDKPRVDRVEGIPPAIAIDQTNPVRTSRSTVGTMTELNDHIKLLFARLAELYCQRCGDKVENQSPQSIHTQCSEQFPDNQRIMITFKVEVPDNFTRDEIETWLQRQGYTRVLKRTRKFLTVVQDRLRLNADNAGRFNDALEAALKHGHGQLSIHTLDDNREPTDEYPFSTVLECARCRLSYKPATPSLFSFNSPVGACDTCRGFGRVMGIDYNLVIPDGNLTLREGAIKVWQSKTNAICQRDMERYAKRQKFDLDTPWKDLDDRHKHWVIHGERKNKGDDNWYGIKGFFNWLEGRAYKMHVRVMLSRYRSYDQCPDCQGARLKPEALNWRVGSLAQAADVIEPAKRFTPSSSKQSSKVRKNIPGLNVHDLMRLPISQCHQFVESLAATAGSNDAAELVLGEMTSRLRYLTDVGVGYLTLDRQSRTLSGGEVQRINLTTALGTSLVNTLFVLDEPSIGMHARDMNRINRVLHRLRDNGNTLLVVEHDPQVMLAADRIIDMGPAPGNAGGQIVFHGTVPQLLKSRKSLTAQYLNGNRRIELQRQVKPLKRGKALKITGANEHNLKNLSVSFPLGKLVTVTGPSGSGKSTLLNDILYLALKQKLGSAAGTPGEHKRISGWEHIDDVVLVDQTAIGKSARSNPVSYTGAFEEIRKLFAVEPVAQERGYTAGSFSFNAGMRCPTCSGNGFEHVEMQFLSDVYLRCSDCDGSRYRAEVMDVRLFSNQSDHQPEDLRRGLSIGDVLNLTVDEAITFFAPWPRVLKALQPLRDVGLGYVTLGQPVPTLSGGEAQRLKLASHLAKADKGGESHQLFLFDEPTTGLHFDDIDKLLQAFMQLLDAGHSIILIEHNLDVITHSDWVIDLGPEGGDAGGTLVFAGTVTDLQEHQHSHTAEALRQHAFELTAMRQQSALLAVNELSAEYAKEQAENPNAITVQQAREHNLKNLDVAVPRDKLVVVTGMSGSGKSTLAFDIIFNEGQRRYLESLNAYARQFVQPASRPDVDTVIGIPPTVAIEQRTSRGGRKSTVATMTELYHFLRLLFVKLGTQYCPDCDIEITDQSPDAIIAQIQKRWRGKSVQLLAPLIVARKGYYTDLAKWAERHGFEHLRVDGEYLPTDNWPRLDRFREHDIDLPIGSLNVSPRNEGALQQMLLRAIDHGKGLVKVQLLNKNGKPAGQAQLFSTIRACPQCHSSFAEPDPRLFSYNSSIGWCDTCFGTGELLKGFDAEQSGEEDIWLNDSNEPDKVCKLCQGSRLNATALAVRFRDKSIADYCALSVGKATTVFARLKLAEREKDIARDILLELNSRLKFLNEVGLSYLTLERAAPTLSGGEAQRIRLAAQLGSNLRGVCYVLDEPTIGLHPRDNRMLLDTLKGLREKGNSIIVVEHDEETIRDAEYIIDIGPGAGINGGTVVAQGSLAKICANRESVTGRMLKSPPLAPRTERADRIKSADYLEIRSAYANNLKHIDLRIPLQTLTCLTGVSGSGKSTLLREVLYRNLSVLGSRKSRRKLGRLSGCESIDGWQPIHRVLEVDQTPIGRTPRSCPATYVGFWDQIRRLFAETTESRIRGFTASRYSFNVRGGRCDECDGQGHKRMEMSFLPDVKVPCEYCKGARFNRETLSVTWRDKSIGDVLAMSVDEAVEFFNAHNLIRHPLQLLQDVGLGYLTLGQPSPTLSGGEAQRIKLVSELTRAGPEVDQPGQNGGQTEGRRRGSRLHTLYLLDEPTVGLHMADVQKLLNVLHRLVDSGNSVIVIEHNTDLMAQADWLIDMGPEGGQAGGRVVTAGTPAKVARSRRSRTAPWLVGHFEKA